LPPLPRGTETWPFNLKGRVSSRNWKEKETFSRAAGGEKRQASAPPRAAPCRQRNDTLATAWVGRDNNELGGARLGGTAGGSPPEETYEPQKSRM